MAGQARLFSIGNYRPGSVRKGMALGVERPVPFSSCRPNVARLGFRLGPQTPAAFRVAGQSRVALDRRGE
jgi:hypothetical protein